MARTRIQKTNALRELDRAGISYEVRTYEVEGDDAPADYGLSVARMLGEDPDRIFKTLVTQTPSGGHVVCCIPVALELDLKRAAAAAGEKSLQMIHVRDLEDVTGYVRGGCSPVGMRKQFPTLVDESAQLYDVIGISGGRRGLQIVLSPEDLASFTKATFADIARAVV